MISANRIKYNGIFSNELNMPDMITCVAMDSDNGETSTYLNREAVVSESYDGRYKRISNFKYTETFAPKFSFFKKDFGDFTMEEVRIVLKWLTSKDTTALLETYYDDSNVVSWASIGGWTEIQTYKLANNRTIAITAVWDSISPFAMSDIYTITQTITNPTNNKITINIDTDDNKPVYPRVTIDHGYGGAHHTVVRIPDGTVYTVNTDMITDTAYFNGTTYYWKPSGETYRVEATKPTTEYNKNWPVETATTEPTMSSMKNKTLYLYNSKYYWIDPAFVLRSSTVNPNLSTTSVRITNKHTDFLNQSKVLTPTIIKKNNNTEKVVLDGANKIVSSSSVNRVFDTDFVNWNWLALLDGKNEITVEGNCMITLEWREVRKVGEY